MERRGTDGETLIRRPKTYSVIKNEQDRQCTDNVTMRRGRAAIVAVEKQ